MSSKGIIVDSIKWFKKKKRIQKANKGCFFDIIKAPVIKDSIIIIANNVPGVLMRESDIGIS
jgi:hypothetical protein